MTEQGPADPAGWPTGRLLSTAARTVEHAWSEALGSLGLTHAGLVVLHLLETGPQMQRDLAASARVTVQTMSRTIDRLAREGLVERRPDPADRRRATVVRTPDGDRVLGEARSLEADVFPEVADPDALRTALLQIVAGHR